MKESASEYFKTRQGNCAQSVTLAWEKKHNSESNLVEQHAAHGGGRAPEGYCGALYAARELAGEKKDKLTEEFKKHTNGNTACRDIRKSKTLSCVECVGLAAKLLEEIK